LEVEILAWEFATMSMTEDVAIARNPTARTSKDTPWRKGRLFVEVTQEHIDEALRASSSHCAIAVAIQSALPDAKFVSVDLQSVRLSDFERGLRYCFLTPWAARDLIVNFDQGDAEKCKPITFSMNPCTVTRCGKRRTHTPDPEQLKGLGLRVAADQPHIEATCREIRPSRRGSPPESRSLPTIGRREWSPTLPVRIPVEVRSTRDLVTGGTPAPQRCQKWQLRSAPIRVRRQGQDASQRVAALPALNRAAPLRMLIHLRQIEITR
jgi:hypothetical protein